MSNPIHINRLKVVSCAVAGRPGLSAYQIAVLNGYTGSEEQWLASLKGDKGDTGAAGQDGTNGIIWYTSITPSIAVGGGYYIAVSSLTGPDGETPAAGNMIVTSGGYGYFIDGIDDGVANLSSNRVSIKGDAGAPGVVWYTTAGQVNDRIAKSALDGVSGATPAVGQQVISADGSGEVYLYIISSIETSYIVVDTANKKSLRGPQGQTGTNGTNAVIWYTTVAPSSRTALSGGVIAAEGLQGPDGAVVAAGQMIVSSATGKAYWTAGPVEDDVVPLELYEITIAAT